MSSKRMRHAKRMGKAYGKRYWDMMSQEAFLECFVPTFIWPVTVAERPAHPDPTGCLRLFVREADKLDVRSWHGSCPHPAPYNHLPGLCPAAPVRVGRFPVKDVIVAARTADDDYVDPTDGVRVGLGYAPAAHASMKAAAVALWKREKAPMFSR